MWKNIWFEYWKDFKAHSVEEIIIQILSVFFILSLGILAIRIVGKKSINTLTVPNVLFIFVLSSTLGALITKPNRIIMGAIVCFTIIIFIVFLEKIIIKFDLFEKILVAKPAILYTNGEYQVKTISKNKMTIDQIEAWLRMQGYHSVEVCKTIILEFGGNLAFELLPEYEPIKKIYFDSAIKQILNAINKSDYEEVIPDIKNNLFEEAIKGRNTKNPGKLE